MNDFVLVKRPDVHYQTVLVDLNGEPLVTIEVPLIGTTPKEPPATDRL